MRGEIESICKGRNPDLELLKEMKYLRATLNEVLRLSPPVPMDDKTAVKDDILPDGTKIKAGTIVSWLACNLGKNPLYFSDPHIFRPERWLSKEENGGLEIPSDSSNSPPWIPFQAGPRKCMFVCFLKSFFRLFKM